MSEETEMQGRLGVDAKEPLATVLTEEFNDNYIVGLKNDKVDSTNIDSFIARIEQAYYDYGNAIDDSLLSIIENYTIHPDYKKYFSVVIEKTKGQQKEDIKDAEKKEEELKWHGLTVNRWKERFAVAMDLDRTIIGKLLMRDELLWLGFKKMSNLLRDIGKKAIDAKSDAVAGAKLVEVNQRQAIKRWALNYIAEGNDIEQYGVGVKCSEALGFEKNYTAVALNQLKKEGQIKAKVPIPV